ncbi:leucyl/phenylalanyl-tRNA--protein transferase [Robbsia sp. Bb-Pol-6]|uniref:Leucyl/phenylalanyl-tRNA--protein transferase n=1 Tax=Robbsia betulipollinis TaxID=2981849 RepID=A0ABT3ZN95_9BURK|nr:leucyl/phenylalanyl-tRNA--protein transferase [Robbsia betulipollinis]MCY0387994.1 leucyl/phenylalanyl-tRNA--protein transferase [Robbsia betulipollinis]
MIPWLAAIDPFPALERALDAASDAPGLLAASADLTPARLECAYRSGIFPWYSAGQPVLWWSPDPRMVLRPAAFKVAPSLRKTLKAVLRDARWQVRVDVDFRAVMSACADTPREGQNGTWITPSIIAAYGALHAKGLAHSVETWYDGERVGGLYGVAIGAMFFGESMFAHRSDASKIALAALCAHLRRHAVELIDCQQNTAHLARLGGSEIDRAVFVRHLGRACAQPAIPWDFGKQTLADWLSAPG